MKHHKKRASDRMISKITVGEASCLLSEWIDLVDGEGARALLSEWSEQSFVLPLFSTTSAQDAWEPLLSNFVTDVQPFDCLAMGESVTQSMSAFPARMGVRPSLIEDGFYVSIRRGLEHELGRDALLEPEKALSTLATVFRDFTVAVYPALRSVREDQTMARSTQSGAGQRAAGSRNGRHRVR